MKLDINPRGNGACPICKYNHVCSIQTVIAESLKPVHDPEAEMEIVVYSCPKFLEQA